MNGIDIVLEQTKSMLMVFQTIYSICPNTEVGIASSAFARNVYYFCLGLYDYSCTCDDADLTLCQQYVSEKPASNIPEFIDLAELIMEEEDIQEPTNAMEALSLYLTLVNLITQIP